MCIFYLACSLICFRLYFLYYSSYISNRGSSSLTSCFITLGRSEGFFKAASDIGYGQASTDSYNPVNGTNNERTTCAVAYHPSSGLLSRYCHIGISGLPGCFNTI